MSEEIEVTAEVFCTLQFEGIHCWPECPFEEVAYLRDPHRHMFHIKAWKEVQHNDRDVEFIMLKHRIAQYLDDKYPTKQLGRTSCEMLAKDLIERFDLKACEVSEDGENGAILFRTPLFTTVDSHYVDPNHSKKTVYDIH